MKKPYKVKKKLMFKFLIAILLITILFVLVIIFIFPKKMYNLFSKKNDDVEVKIKNKPAQSSEPERATNPSEFIDFEDVEE